MAREPEVARDVYELLRLAKKAADAALRHLQGSDRDDVVQRVALKLWQSHGRRSGDQLAFELARSLNSKYILTTIRREAKSEARRQRVRVDTSLLEDIARGENVETSDVDETLKLVEEVLTRVPSRQRTALRLLYLEGKDVAEIARVLGTSVNAVHTLVSRGRRRILEAFGKNAR